MLASLPRPDMYIVSSVRVLTFRKSTKRQRDLALGSVGRPDRVEGMAVVHISIEVRCRCRVTRSVTDPRPGACGTCLRYSCINFHLFDVQISVSCMDAKCQLLDWTCPYKGSHGEAEKESQMIAEAYIYAKKEGTNCLRQPTHALLVKSEV
jgi:hypothetical protein